MVGNDSISNLVDSASFAFFNSALCFSISFLVFGKSTSTRTKLAFAKVANSSDENTFFFSALQGGHQSEPVKSIRTSLFSVLAWLLALAKSVSHSTSAALAAHRLNTAIRLNAIFF